MGSRELLFAALGDLPCAVALLTQLRWPHGPCCCHCGSQSVGGHGVYWREPALSRYRCKQCRHTFMVTTGTAFAYSRVGLCQWVVLAWLVALGHSALRAAKETGLRYVRAYHLVWWLMTAALSLEEGPVLAGVVEADEIYVRCGHKGRQALIQDAELGAEAYAEGERKGRRRGLRHGPGRGHADQDRPAIFVLVQRGGGVRIEAAPNVERGTVTRLFGEAVEAGSEVYTDSAKCYLVLREKGYELEQVNHSQREYAREKAPGVVVHENGAEGEIRWLKHFLNGRAGVSMRNLPTYLKLYQFGRNHGDQPCWERATLLLSTLLGAGPPMYCLLPPNWAHSLADCTVGRYTPLE